MKVLAVCNKTSVLAELCRILSTLYPQAEIIRQTDPLMACQYSFNNKVDYVFATEDMKRMSGSDLLRFIKKDNPSVKIYLIYKDNQTTLSFFDESDGAINYPFSLEELTEKLNLD